MVDAAASVEWIVASGEVDALMLEFNLIQQHLPRFNIRYRDDKSYPVPRAHGRGEVAAGAGPPGHEAEEGPVLRSVRPRLGDPRHARRPDARLPHPHLHEPLLRPARPRGTARASTTTSADAPAPASPPPRGSRRRRTDSDVDALGDFLAGNSKPVLRRLEEQMADASGREEYEQAARFRDQLQAARRALESQEMVLVQPESLDVVGLAEDDLEAAFQVFTVRGGRVLGRKGWIVDRVEDLDRPELVASFLRQLYMEREEVPPRILVPTEPADREVLETWLSDRRGSHVTIAVPARGAKRRLMEVVASNATRGVPPAQAPAGLGLRRPLPRALGARRAARPRAGTAADRVLRHLQPRALRHGGIDGGLRGRPAQALRLPPVRDQGRPRTGRFRQHGGDAHPPVLAAAEGEGQRRRGQAAAVLLPAGARRGGRRPRAAERRDEGPRGPRAPHPARRPRQATRGDLLPRPPRPARRSRGGRRRSSCCSTSATRRTASRSRTTGSGAIAGRSPRRSTRSPASDRPASAR